MGPGEHRPYDHDYWTVPWSTGLFAGDLFEAIPFTDQPTVLLAEEMSTTSQSTLSGRSPTVTGC